MYIYDEYSTVPSVLEAARVEERVEEAARIDEVVEEVNPIYECGGYGNEEAGQPYAEVKLKNN